MTDNFSDFERDTMDLLELRKRLGISQTVAYALANKNELPVPVIRIGRQFRFSRRAWDALMAAQHSGAPQERNSAA